MTRIGVGMPHGLCFHPGSATCWLWGSGQGTKSAFLSFFIWTMGVPRAHTRKGTLEQENTKQNGRLCCPCLLCSPPASKPPTQHCSHSHWELSETTAVRLGPQGSMQHTGRLVLLTPPQWLPSQTARVCSEGAREEHDIESFHAQSWN